VKGGGGVPGVEYVLCHRLQSYIHLYPVPDLQSAAEHNGDMTLMPRVDRNPRPQYVHCDSRVPAVLLEGNSRNVCLLLSVFLARKLITDLVM
jgi:hypothetical protein